MLQISLPLRTMLEVVTTMTNFTSEVGHVLMWSVVVQGLKHPRLNSLSPTKAFFSVMKICLFTVPKDVQWFSSFSPVVLGKRRVQFLGWRNRKRRLKGRKKMKWSVTLARVHVGTMVTLAHSGSEGFVTLMSKITQHTLLYTKVKSQGLQMVCFSSKFPKYSLESYFHHEVLMQSEANDIILLSQVISHNRSELLESGAARFI